MKLRLSLVLGVALVAAFLLAACAPQGPAVPSDPVEAVKLIADKQKEIKSEHFDITLDLTLKADGLPADDPSAVFLKNFKANFTGTGDVDSASQDFQLKGTADLGVLTAFLSNGADKLDLEVRKIGDKTYTKIADQDWTESTVDTTTTSGDNSIDPEMFSELLKKAAKAQKLGDEAIDGADSYHYQVDLDTEELLAQIASLAESQGSPVTESDLAQARELLKDSEILIDLWVGKADLLVRQESVTLNLDLKNIPDSPPDLHIQVNFVLTFKASKFNEAVKIEAPQ